jgi:hypothetical protein
VSGDPTAAEYRSTHVKHTKPKFPFFGFFFSNFLLKQIFVITAHAAGILNILYGTGIKIYTFRSAGVNGWFYHKCDTCPLFPASRVFFTG